MMRPVITLVDGEPVVSWVDNDDLAEYTDLITSEHNQRPKYMAMVGGVVDSPKSLRDWYEGVPTYFDLDTATGAQLDILGEWIGRSRVIAQPIDNVYFTWDASDESHIDVTYALAPAAVTRSIGTGNGTNTHFTMAVPPVGAFDVFVADWQGNQKQYATPRTNLARFSTDFTGGAWLPNAASVAPNATLGPDGATMADKLVEDTTTAQHYVRQLFNVTTGRLVVYFVDAAPAERTVITLFSSSTTGSPSVRYNLVTGVFTAPAGDFLVDYGAIALPNGFTRVWICVTPPTTSTGVSFYCGMVNGTTSYLGDGVSGVYIANAQFMEGRYPTSLIVTGTAPAPVTDYAYTAPNVIDFAVAPAAAAAVTAVYGNAIKSFPFPTTPGLVVPQISVINWESRQLQYTTPRTNYLLNSNDISLWTFTGARGTVNNILGPDGVTFAGKLVEDVSNGVHQGRVTQAVTIGQYNVFWADLKAAERTSVRIAGSSPATGTPSIFCNLLTGAVTNQGGTGLVDSGAINLGNGWWRVWICCLNTASMASVNFYIGLAITGTTTTYTGNGAGAFGVYVAHGQFEDGKVPTSSIVTGAAPVTVGADYTYVAPNDVTFAVAPLSGSLINVSGDVFSFSRLGWDSGYWKGEFDPNAGIISLPDDAYRTLLRAKIAANHWDGSIEGAYDVWQQAFQGTSIILIQDNQDMSMVVAISGTLLDPITEALLTGGYIPLRPEGVQINYYAVIPTAGRLFGWDTDNVALAGWDTGLWANELLPT